MASGEKLVPDGRTVIDGIGGNSLDPRAETVPAQGGRPGRKSDRLDTVANAPPRPSNEQTEAPDASNAADVLEIIEGTRDDNPTNETVAEKAMERGARR
jgi:hypothetical protein